MEEKEQSKLGRKLSEESSEDNVAKKAERFRDLEKSNLIPDVQCDRFILKQVPAPKHKLLESDNSSWIELMKALGEDQK